MNHPISPLSPETRKRLGEAVLDIFSEVDFHRANMRELARKAKVSLSTIYQNYGSKEGLLFTFVDNWISELTERMMDHLQGIEDLKEKLRKVFWVQMDYYERNIKVGRILFLTVPFQKWMDDKTFKQKRMYDIFLEVIKQGQNEERLNPNVRAGVLIDFMHGIFYRTFTMWIYRGQKESLASQANVLFEMYWRAISNPELQKLSSTGAAGISENLNSR